MQNELENCQSILNKIENTDEIKIYLQEIGKSHDQLKSFFQETNLKWEKKIFGIFG